MYFFVVIEVAGCNETFSTEGANMRPCSGMVSIKKKYVDYNFFELGLKFNEIRTDDMFN